MSYDPLSFVIVFVCTKGSKKGCVLALRTKSSDKSDKAKIKNSKLNVKINVQLILVLDIS